MQINQYVYIDRMINTSAFTYFSQIRVVNEETAYISPTSGEHWLSPFVTDRAQTAAPFDRLYNASGLPVLESSKVAAVVPA